MFFKFFKLISNQKGRSTLLIISFCSIFISSFSLFILQSVMNGLQHNLKSRSKSWLGAKVYTFNEKVVNKEIFSTFSVAADEISFESNLEGIVDLNGVISPALFRGIYWTNSDNVISKNKGASLGFNLSIKAGVDIGEKILISIPHVVDEFFEDRPRVKSVFVENFFESNVSEVDEYHVFVKTNSLEDLTHVKGANLLRVFGDYDNLKVKSLLNKYGFSNIQEFSWEKTNQSLVYALKLEKIIMIFLFSSLTLLISQAISGGFLLLFNRLKFDLASLWVLGISNAKLFSSSLSFFTIFSFALCLLGAAFGFFFSKFIEIYGGNLMPSVFVEKGIPIYITYESTFISIFIPFFISSFFLFGALKRVFEKQNHLTTIRTTS